jgi:hypothetical protein
MEILVDLLLAQVSPASALACAAGSQPRPPLLVVREREANIGVEIAELIGVEIAELKGETQ